MAFSLIIVIYLCTYLLDSVTAWSLGYRATPKNNDDAFIDGVYVINVHSRLVNKCTAGFISSSKGEINFFPNLRTVQLNA